MKRIKDYLWDALIIGGATAIAVLIAFAVLSVRVAHAADQCTPVADIMTETWDAADRGISLVARLQYLATLNLEPDVLASGETMTRGVYRTYSKVKKAGDEYDLIEVWDMYHTACENNLKNTKL